MILLNAATIKSIFVDLLHSMEKSGSGQVLFAPTAENNYIQINDTAKGSLYNISFIDDTLNKVFDATFNVNGLASISYKTIYYDGTHELRLSNVGSNIYAIKLYSNGTELTMNVQLGYITGFRITPAT